MKFKKITNIIKKFISFIEENLNSNYQKVGDTIRAKDFERFQTSVKKIKNINYLDEKDDWNYLFYAINSYSSLYFIKDRQENLEQLNNAYKIVEFLLKKTDIDINHQSNDDSNIFSFAFDKNCTPLFELFISQKKTLEALKSEQNQEIFFNYYKKLKHIWSGFEIKRHQDFFQTIFLLAENQVPVSFKILNHIIDNANCENITTYNTIKNFLIVKNNQKELESLPLKKTHKKISI